MSMRIVSSERQVREVQAAIDDIDRALSSERALQAILDGFPPVVVEGVRRSLKTERGELLAALQAYEEAKGGNVEALTQRAGRDIGALLIVARIAKGWSQKELARRVGVQEQAIQRYEAEKYRGISLANLLRIVVTLQSRLTLEFLPPQPFIATPAYEISSTEAYKVLRHAREHNWLKDDDSSDENAIGQLKRYVAEHVISHGTPSLLRTGLNVEDHTADWVLLSWKAQVTRRALKVIEARKLRYRPLDVSWLLSLVRLSRDENGPSQAKDMLQKHGIVLIAEPHVVGMNVDGAAFLVDDVPVIGMTLRRDALDNFWFTLLHELAHVILHYRTGLSSGFFDSIESASLDGLEDEANEFASNMLIPEDIWARSPARIAKSAEPIERFARQLGIAPAIVFGRVRMERKNYKIFADRIGTGKVRGQLFGDLNEVSE